MADPRRCCALGICCPPNLAENRAPALGDLLAGQFDWPKDAGPLTPDAVAGWLLSEFDLVPKGVGDAIVEAYRLEFDGAEVVTS